MRTAIISDIHFMNKSKFNPIVNEYDGILFPLANLELTYEKAKEYNCDNVIILGDIIDKSTVSSYLVHKLINFFKSIDIETIILLGNHDISTNNENTYSFVTVLGEINPMIRIITKTEFITNDIVAVPYNTRFDIVDREDIREKILLTHIGISECKVSQTKKVPADFGIKQLKYFTRVLTGHYHYPQEVENVLIIGSPWEIKRDEYEHDSKRIVIYDFDKLSYESINSIRKIQNPVRIDNIKELRLQLEKIKTEKNPYVNVRFDIPFSIPKEMLESIEQEYGSLVTFNFIDESDKTMLEISSLKKLQEFKLDKLNLNSMFFDYIRTTLSEEEYSILENEFKEVM